MPSKIEFSDWTSQHFNHVFYVLSFSFFLFFFISWLRISYFFGAGWYSLLLASLCLFIARISVIVDGNLAKKQFLHIGFFWIASVVILFNFIGFILIIVAPPLNAPDSFLKPIFVTVSLFFLSALMMLLSSPEVTTEDLEKKDDEEETDDCCCNEPCCNKCGLGTLLVLFFLAALQIIFRSSRDIIYLENDNLIFASGDFETDQLMNFRCEGEGNPFVLLFHGYSGQALDLQHLLDGVKGNTTVCSYSRLGYGLSREFSKNKRVSENIAIELNIALQQLDIDADKFNNVIVAGHSMAGFNMRAYDKLFPGRIAAMVMVDPVEPLLENDCFKGGVELDNTMNELSIRFIDSGIFLFLELIGFAEVVVPISALPDGVQSQYLHNLLRPGFFETAIEEAENWGETCEFVLGHTAEYPVTVFIPDQGIYANNLTEANIIQTFSSNPDSKTIPQRGDDAFHVDALFDIRFAQPVVDELLELIEKVRSTTTED